MEMKSERVGKFLFLSLIVGLICSFISFLCSIIHAVSEEFFFNYVEWIDSALALFNFVLGLLTIILFLVWIYRVHSDFGQIRADYPITPGGALCRIMIPFYNIFGLWTVYSTMARFMAKVDDKTKRYGQRLMGLIPFYYFGQMIYNGLNRAMLKSDLPSISLELWTMGFEVIVSIIYIIMFVIITSGLRATHEYVAVEEASALTQG